MVRIEFELLKSQTMEQEERNQIKQEQNTTYILLSSPFVVGNLDDKPGWRPASHPPMVVATGVCSIIFFCDRSIHLYTLDVKPD